jgi:2-keto-4-pentenoate hydratase/2-oxohepta-3-ene-1,7-dioic acid hydratase in catechol pathway
MPQPGNVRAMTWVNGKIMQGGSIIEWLFSLPRLLSFPPHMMTLEPGKPVPAGTAVADGLLHNPQAFLQPGEPVEIGPGGMGVLRHMIGWRA